MYIIETKFPGYDPRNPKHVAFTDEIRKYEDILEYEMWDLRLGPAIWTRYIAVHPNYAIDPDQKIELQRWVQGYIYQLPARKFLALMKEILAGTQRAKDIVANLTRAVEKLLAEE